MSSRPLVVMMVIAGLVSSCGPGERDEPAPGIVLWESDRVEPRFPVPPEAAWEPRYQRLFQEHQEEVGGDVRWACYSTADPEQAVEFYAELFDEELRWQPEHPETWQALAQRMSSAAGIEPPQAPPVGTRWAQLLQRDDLPSVTLHTPFFDASAGLVSEGALVVLRWAAEEPE